MKALRAVSAAAFLLLAAGLFASPARLADYYASASEPSRAAIRRASDLAVAGKWKSAFDSLSAIDPASSDPYILAAKIGLCLDGYVRSSMHRLFAFKDLSAGENLAALRSGAGEYDMVEFDPVALATAQDDAGTKAPPVLEKALADYFYAVINLYSGSWLASDEEVGAMSLGGYARARDGGAYDAGSLANEGELLIRSDRADEAEPLLREAIALDAKAPIPHFNLAVSFLVRGSPKEALAEFDVSIGLLAGSERLFDAYSLAARSAYAAGEAPRAKAYLDAAEAAFPGDAAAGLVRHAIALEAGDAPAADEAADKVFARWPKQPYVVRSLISAWAQNGMFEAAEAFIARNLPKAAADDEASGSLLFYSSILTAQGGPAGPNPESIAAALERLAEAEARFRKAYPAEHEVFSAIATVRAQFNGALAAPPAPTDVPDEGAAGGEGETDATSAATGE